MTVPLWAAILSALAAGLIGTLARISFEREAELRTRAIEACDAYALTAVHAFERVWQTIKARDEGGFTVEQEEAFVRDAKQALDELERKLTRLQILLGRTTAPTWYAAQSFTALETALASVEEWPPDVEDMLGDTDNMTGEEFDEHFSSVLNSEWEDDILDARLFADYALQSFQKFKDGAAWHLHASRTTRRVRDTLRWRQRRQDPWHVAARRQRDREAAQR
ncbi:MAG: hypothetical protein ACRDPP_00045 [Gaiellaceae bacterium]